MEMSLPSSASTNITAVSNPTTTTPVADPIPPFADQSHSRLMTLPKELRNIIYEFVVYDTSTHVHEPVSYYWNDVERNITNKIVGCLVPLDRTTPPSKDSILPCRQLHSEMKQMYTAAYRAYWRTKHFLYSDASMSACLKAPPLATNKTLSRIEHFIIAITPSWHFHISFDGLKWKSYLLPTAPHKPFTAQQMEMWEIDQGVLQNMVPDGICTPDWIPNDPRAGRGLTRKLLMAIARRKNVAMHLQQNLPIEGSMAGDNAVSNP